MKDTVPHIVKLADITGLGYYRARNEHPLICSRFVKAFLGTLPEKIKLTFSRSPLKGGFEVRRNGFLYVKIVNAERRKQLDPLSRYSQDLTATYSEIHDMMDKIGIDPHVRGRFYVHIEEWKGH